MPELVDFIVILDDRMTVRHVEWVAHPLSPAAEQLTEGWMGLSLLKIPDAAWDLPGGSLLWQGQRFDIARCTLDGSTHCILARRENVREKLLEGALDAISDSVQVYDKNLRAVYFNRVFRKMLDVPSGMSWEGKRLLDIFEVDETYGTTITALREKRAVSGRFDKYKSMTGKELQTVNAAHLIMQGERVLGAISIERDMQLTKKMIADLLEDQNILSQHLQPSVHLQGNVRYTLRNLIGFSPALVSAVELARKMAPNESAILIQGETGTGKEIFAQGIHALSSRRDKNFVAVNCAAIPESLIEGTLFGTVKGAFTGSADKAGLMEEANHGTLFLDEMNSMSPSMQAKLLRVLQEKKLRRVGGTKEIPIDVRIISSCNENVYTLMESGRLRRDIFYRLSSVVIEIPPLRERGRDLEELVWYYIRSTSGVEPVNEIEQGFWERLYAHRWPGNVRELFHILGYALNVSEGGVLRERDLPSYFPGARSGAVLPEPETVISEPPESGPDKSSYAAGFNALCADYERRIISGAFATCGGNLTKTAELLKLSRQNLQYYIRKYNVK